MADKDIKGELDAAELFDESGLIFEINRLVLHPIGYHLGTPVIAGKKTLKVLDYADAEGGLAYDSREWREWKRKLVSFNKKREVVRRISERVRSLGCIAQETANGPRASGSKDPRKRRPSTSRRP